MSMFSIRDFIMVNWACKRASHDIGKNSKAGGYPSSIVYKILSREVKRHGQLYLNYASTIYIGMNILFESHLFLSYTYMYTMRWS